jgi:transposase-like protein
MANHRSYSVEFKRQVVQDYLSGRRFTGSPNGMTSAAT